MAGVAPYEVDAVAVANATHSTYAAAHWEGVYPKDWKRKALIGMSKVGLAAKTTAIAISPRAVAMAMTDSFSRRRAM